MPNKLAKNLLFISPDSLPPGISRAYWLANGLSCFFNVYYIQWEDSRKHRWLTNNAGFSLESRFAKSAFAFLKSIQPKTEFFLEHSFGARNLYYVYLPVMLKSPLSHFLGEINARKISREFNRKSFLKLTRKIQFDYIFHGDNMMLAPIISDTIPSFFDAQDDFDEAHEPLPLLEYEKKYLQKYVSRCRKNFAITKTTADHFSRLSGCQFEILPNGADFNSISSISESDITRKKEKLNLQNHFVVSYIGGNGWFDPVFFEKLVTLSLEKAPEIHYLTVGRIPFLKRFPNLTQIGFVPPEEVNLFYRLSDLGLLPRNSDLDFFKNSHPLKIIQYAAAKKPVLMPVMSDMESLRFANIFQTDFCVTKWLEKIMELKNFAWTGDLTEKWYGFSWQSICKNLADAIQKERPFMREKNQPAN